MQHKEVRFQELRRLSVGADARGGDMFEVQLTSHSQSMRSDLKIQPFACYAGIPRCPRARRDSRRY